MISDFWDFPCNYEAGKFGFENTRREIEPFSRAIVAVADRKSPYLIPLLHTPG